MKKQKTTRKQWIMYLLTTIVLGTAAYFLGATVTKAILDRQKKEKQTVDFEQLTNVETIENITLDDYLAAYNQKATTIPIKKEELKKVENGYEITKDDISFYFQVKNDNLAIIVLKYKTENETIKETIKLMIEANNEEIEAESADKLYENVLKTRNTTQDHNTSTSEFFQYKGVEVSEKKFEDQESTYQFRIGRITKEKENN